MKHKNDSKHGNHNEGAGIDRKLHDPVQDRLIPLEPLDPKKIHSVDDLVRAMAKTAFTGRQLGEAADVLEAKCSISPPKPSKTSWLSPSIK